MLREFKLPDVGEGLTEAEIVKWHVAPGDTVTVNQTIVEIETAKAVVELPCPFEGTVAELLVAEGQTVEVGTPIISVRTGDAPAAPEPAAPAEQNGQAVKAEQDGTAEKREPVLVGYGVKPGATRRRRRSTAAATAPTPAAPTPAAPAPSRPGRSG
ncbi:MAG: 2-oxo acid dehydrogenase subunit E2, partial [Thermobispora bispora]|nr:2-oxo acid dehydrogenase subunit E2 [Thermobispora bispora]